MTRKLRCSARICIRERHMLCAVTTACHMIMRSRDDQAASMPTTHRKKLRHREAQQYTPELRQDPLLMQSRKKQERVIGSKRACHSNKRQGQWSTLLLDRTQRTSCCKVAEMEESEIHCAWGAQESASQNSTATSSPSSITALSRAATTCRSMVYCFDEGKK